MHVRRSTVIVETDASGDATAYTDELNGMLATIQYVKDDYADTVDFTITEEDTGLALWDEDNITASTVRSPRMLTHTTAGVSTTLSDAAIPIRGRIKIVIAQGGNAKGGVFTVTVI